MEKEGINLAEKKKKKRKIVEQGDDDDEIITITDTELFQRHERLKKNLERLEAELERRCLLFTALKQTELEAVKCKSAACVSEENLEGSMVDAASISRYNTQLMKSGNVDILGQNPRKYRGKTLEVDASVETRSDEIKEANRGTDVNPSKRSKVLLSKGSDFPKTRRTLVIVL